MVTGRLIENSEILKFSPTTVLYSKRSYFDTAERNERIFLSQAQL